MDETDFDFRNQIQNTDWYPLEIHHKNGALFKVASSLDLSEVATAVAKDQLERVKSWIDQGHIGRVDEEQAIEWRKDPYKIIGRFIIVAPYVFLQINQ